MATINTSFNPVKAAAVLGLCFALGPSIAGFFIYQGIVEAKLGDRYVTARALWNVLRNLTVELLK